MKFLNNKEAAEYLRVKEATMEIWRHRGTGPRFRRAGRRILYAIEDIEAFVSESMGSTSDTEHVRRRRVRERQTGTGAPRDHRESEYEVILRALHRVQADSAPGSIAIHVTETEEEDCRVIEFEEMGPAVALTFTLDGELTWLSGAYS